MSQQKKQKVNEQNGETSEIELPVSAVSSASATRFEQSGNQVLSEGFEQDDDFESTGIQRAQHGNNFCLSLFPSASFLSWTCVLICMQLIGFFLVIFQEQKVTQLQKEVVCPSYYVEKQIRETKCLTVGECAVFPFGGRYTAAIINEGEYIRFIASLFVYYDPIQLFITVFTQMMYGFMSENYYGWKKYLLVFFGAGTIGNLFGMLFRADKVYAGASTSIAGIYGMNAVYMIEHYKYFGQDRRLQIKNFAWIILSVFMVFSMDEYAEITSIPFSFAFGAILAFNFTTTQSLKAAIAKKILLVVFALVTLAAAYCFLFELSPTFRPELIKCTF